MHFSIPSLLSISCLALLSSTGLAAVHPRTYDSTRLYQDEASVEINRLYARLALILNDSEYDDLKYVVAANVTVCVGGGNYTSLSTLIEAEKESQPTPGTTFSTYGNIYIHDFKPDAGDPTSAIVDLSGVIISFGEGNSTGQTTTSYVRAKDLVVKYDGHWKLQVGKILGEIIRKGVV